MTTTTTTMTTSYQIVINGNTTVQIDADGYRLAERHSAVHQELYLYADGEDDPVATFPPGSWIGIYEADRGGNVIEIK